MVGVLGWPWLAAEFLDIVCLQTGIACADGRTAVPSVGAQQALKVE